jgi:histone deacetylase 1/2
MAPPPSTNTMPYSLDYTAMLPQAMSANEALVNPQQIEWMVDSGASSHVTGKMGNLTSSHSNSDINSQHIIVGDGSKIPIIATSSVQISKIPLYLQNVLVSPSIVKNLILIWQFTHDNFGSIEFDPFCFFVKHLATKTLLHCSNSDGDLYSFHGSGISSPTVLSTLGGNIWHHRLGHPSTMAHYPLDFLSCKNNSTRHSSLCESHPLGHHTRLPFPTSTSHTTAPFQLIHCDLWTSPVVSFLGYKYYLIVLDDFTHYSWTFTLHNKSDTCTTIQYLIEFVWTQYDVTIKCLQCDNGGEFLTTSLREFFSHHGVIFWLSCPHISPQNGKAECLIRTTNNIVRTLLVHAKLPPPFWVEALHTATHLLNIRPSRSIDFHTPHYRLYGQHPSYDHL